METVVELRLGLDGARGVVRVDLDGPVVRAGGDEGARIDGVRAVSVGAEEPVDGDRLVIRTGGIVVGVLGV